MDQTEEENAKPFISGLSFPAHCNPASIDFPMKIVTKKRKSGTRIEKEGQIQADSSYPPATLRELGEPQGVG